MKISALTLTAVFLAGTAHAAPVELFGSFSVAAIADGEVAPERDISLNDDVSVSFVLDDDAFLDFLFNNETPPPVELFTTRADEPEQDEPIFGLIPLNRGVFNLPAVAQFSREGVATERLEFTEYSVTTFDNFTPDEEAIAQYENAFGTVPEAFSTSVDVIELTASTGFLFEDEVGPSELEGMTLHAFSDSNWLERAAAAFEAGDETFDPLEGVEFVFSADFINIEARDVVRGQETLAIDAGLNGAMTLANLGEGRSEDDPVLPLQELTTENGFVFVLPENIVRPRETLFIDPEVAVGYTYEIETANLTFFSVTAPTQAAVPDADGYELVITLGDGSVVRVSILAGQEIRFAEDLGLSDITKFVLEGIDPNLALLPDDGLAFITGVAFNEPLLTPATLTQTAIVANVSAVPLPAAGWLLLAGFGALAGLRRRMQA